jgi:hypothetical protein
MIATDHADNLHVKFVSLTADEYNRTSLLEFTAGKQSHPAGSNIYNPDYYATQNKSMIATDHADNLHVKFVSLTADEYN